MNLSIKQREVELESTFSPRLWALVHDTPVLCEALFPEVPPGSTRAAAAHASNRHTCVTMKQTEMPIATGSREATVVQRALRVSL